MKKYISILTLTATLLMMASCSHNNGDIGPWFGQWKLIEIKVDGVTDYSYNGNIFWSFQTHVFQMKEVIGDISPVSDTRWGTWEENGGELLLNFTYMNSEHKEIYYDPLTATFLPPHEISRLKILKRPGSEMELSYTSPDGKLITYFLKRW